VLLRDGSPGAPPSNARRTVGSGSIGVKTSHKRTEWAGPGERLLTLDGRAASPPCGCRKPHPRSSGGVFVLVDDAGEAVTSADVELGEVARICDRIREWV
jgi:hypothetical protein